MKRKYCALTALLLALCLLLSGCGELKKIEKEAQAFRADRAVAVARYDGGEVTADEVLGEFNTVYGVYYNYSAMLGYDLGAEEIEKLMSSAIEEHVRMEIAAAHFDAEYALTDEEIAAVNAEVEEKHAQLLEQTIAQQEGSEQEKQARAELALLKSGYDLESLRACALLWKKAARMEEILGESVAAPTEEELRAAYAQKISDYQDALEAGECSVEADMMNADAVVYWMPEGYRQVKHILLIPSQEARLACIDAQYAVTKAKEQISSLEEELADAEDYDGEEALERDAALIRQELQAAEAALQEKQADLDAAKQLCRDDVKDRTDEIYARLAQGEDFDALMAEYGEDPGMQSEPAASCGYYVAISSEKWEDNFRDGAMALSAPGDYSPEPVVGDSGVHIIYYLQDAPAGAAAYEDVRDALREDTLEDARSALCAETTAAWVEERNPSYDVAAFRQLFSEEK